MMSEEIDPFEAAMNELAGDSKAPPAEDNTAGELDPFAAAQAELTSGGAPPEEPPSALVSAPSQAPSSSTLDATGSTSLDFLMDIKLKVSFEVGRAQMYISDLLSLGQGSVIELHRLVGEELEVYVNGHLLATGEVVVVNEKFGAKITSILTPEEIVNRLAVMI